MPYVAWVQTSSHKGRDDNWATEEGSTERAWVFMDGLALGRQVLYFCKEHSANGFPRYDRRNYGSFIRKDLQLLAIGEVATIEERVVNFTWAGAAQQKNSDAWAQVTPPKAVLQMEPSSDQECHRASEERSQHAQRCDEYRIHAPAQAWKLVPRQSYVVTLNSLSASTDSHMCLQLNTIGGDAFDVQLPKDSAVGALVQLVEEKLQLRPNTCVNILNLNGELLEPFSMLSC